MSQEEIEAEVDRHRLASRRSPTRSASASSCHSRRGEARTDAASTSRPSTTPSCGTARSAAQPRVGAEAFPEITAPPLPTFAVSGPGPTTRNARHIPRHGMTRRNIALTTALAAGLMPAGAASEPGAMTPDIRLEWRRPRRIGRTRAHGSHDVGAFGAIAVEPPAPPEPRPATWPSAHTRRSAKRVEAAADRNGSTRTSSRPSWPRAAARRYLLTARTARPDVARPRRWKNAPIRLEGRQQPGFGQSQLQLTSSATASANTGGIDPCSPRR